MPYVSQAQRRFMHAQHPAIAKRWDKEFPNQKGLSERKKKRKVPVVVNNKMKGDFGATTFKHKKGHKDEVPTKIEINVKAHKGDKAELASTIKHELLHVKHPKMTEKETYKRSAKTKLSYGEQQQMLAKLRHKKLNYQVGVVKRKFKLVGDVKPGDLFNSMNAQKVAQNKAESDNSISREEKVTIMGAV